jgi:hypothetical protein
MGTISIWHWIIVIAFIAIVVAIIYAVVRLAVRVTRRIK